MLYGLLTTIYVLIGFLLLLLILVQQGKNSLGIGSMGGGTQMLFGGSGGQTFFQKATWFLGFSFMALSLCLAILKPSCIQKGYISRSGTTAMMQEDPKAVCEVEEEKVAEAPVQE